MNGSKQKKGAPPEAVRPLWLLKTIYASERE